MQPTVKRNRAIRIGASSLGVLIVIALALPHLVDVNAFRPELESQLSAALGRQVKVGNLNLSVFSGSVSADSVSIADDPAFSKNPFVTAKSFRAGVKIMPTKRTHNAFALPANFRLGRARVWARREKREPFAKKNEESFVSPF